MRQRQTARGRHAKCQESFPVFGAYVAVALTIGMVLLHRRDTN